MNNHKPSNFSLLDPDVCRCYQTQTRAFGKLSKFSVVLRSLPAFTTCWSCPLLCPLSPTPSDRSHLLLCFSETILQLQMSTEIPLPLGNHPLSHCMRSSPSFIGLIFNCNFKFVLQIFTVSAGQLIKNFSLFNSCYITCPLSGCLLVSQ